MARPSGLLRLLTMVPLQFFLRLVLGILCLCEGDDDQRNPGGAAVRPAQRPWDRAGGTKTGFRTDSTISR